MRYITAIVLICIISGCGSTATKKAKPCVGEFRPVNATGAKTTPVDSDPIKCTA